MTFVAVTLTSVVVAAMVLFASLERRGRRQWSRVPMATYVASQWP